MYIHPIIIKQRENLTRTLQDLKNAGYQTFISKREDSAYGFVEKDGHIVSISGAPYETGLCLSYPYKPCREHGSGIGYGDHNLGYGCLTEEDIGNCI